MIVRTRFAPSPTGVLHLGSIRTALFSWLYARRHNGQFVLRIEDTDRERSTDENVDAILDGMAWLGMQYDEGPIFQSQRFDRYQEVIEQWLKEGHAYPCYCTRDELDALREKQKSAGTKVGYDGRCRGGKTARAGVNPVVRFRNPTDGEVIVNDAVRGRVVFENAQLDDLIIARSNGTPTYNFSVVVDDFDMEITHVIRGDDHLNNTPRQTNMFSALGARCPVFAHLPMILGQDGSKLSKRHGAVDIRDYRELGYLPISMLNYLVRLGWSHGDQEIFTLDEMVRNFDVADVNQSSSTFNPQKLLWVNQQQMLVAETDRLAEELLPFLERRGFDVSQGPSVVDVVRSFRERAETLDEMAEKARFCYEDFSSFDPAAAKKTLRPVVLEPLVALRDRLAGSESWSAACIQRILNETAANFDMKFGKLGQPVRVAVAGGPVSPPIDSTLHLVGRDRAIKRLNMAIDFIEARGKQ
ncbi:MAG: glutamate--tRNA ligase [Gammaproteobacteria bacterium]|nr:glutamate--tRNA ligase [Gammaproteobacteria bacterium]